MKTEPKEALSKLSRVGTILYNCMYEPETEIINKDTARQLIISAFSEGQSSPKIKQLEWVMFEFKDAKDFNYWEAITNFGKYSIKQRFDMVGKFYAWILHEMFLFDTLDEAKQACQEDFEKRVKECLDIADNSNK